MASEENSGEQPIIIKKVVKGDGGHHGGAWKVAYADFVTAMMAFFIVMWIIASSEQTKQMVAAYFQDPGAFSFVTGKMTIPIDLDLKKMKGREEEDGEGKGKNSADQILNSEYYKAIKEAIREKAINDSTQAANRLEQVGEDLEHFIKKLENLNEEMRKIASSIEISMTNEGLRIELIEKDDGNFFQVGSAVLNNNIKFILKEIATETGKLPNFVDIEGHTDARKYGKSNEYTNWELSADRANAARSYMSRTGLWEGQVKKVIGYADQFLKYPENPFDNRNRRISILVQNLKVSDFEIADGDLEAPDKNNTQE